MFGVKTFVGDVYRINSNSMEPTLLEDEWVFVSYDDDPVKRFELVAVRHNGENLVKRAVGLPLEDVRIDTDGDMLIRDDRVSPHEHHISPLDRHPKPIPVFAADDSKDPVETYFSMGGSDKNPWRRLPDWEWELDAREIERDSALGLMRLKPGALALSGGLEAGDAVLECDMKIVEMGGRVRFILVEQGDTFQFSLELDALGGGDAVLTRRSSAQLGQTEVLAQHTLPVDVGRYVNVRFENIDNHLRVEFDDGQFVLEASYETNTPHATDARDEGVNLGERVQFGGEGCVLRFKQVSVGRDLHYTQEGKHGTRPVRLDNKQIFILGDNSAVSRDGRDFGPVDESAVIGKPLWVVWPLSAIREL